MFEIKVKYMDGVEPLDPIYQGDWIDLRCAKALAICQGEHGIIPLGVAMELPAGYEALVLPRSSTFKNFGLLLTNSCGVIDECYNGDNDWWGFPFYATRTIELPKNTRIAQFRIIEHQPELHFKTVERLGNANRGGFGSTGVK